MLEVNDIAVSYGRHRALEGASLRVAKGEICVILGANGAGKSTLLKTIAGMVRAEPGGGIVMNGKSIAAMKPHKIVEEGIALVPEGRGIFGDLTVAENLQLGAFAHRARAQEAATLAEIYRLFPRLAERKAQIARTMSGGEQQMVAIGRALMSRPDILMLDEPSLGLSPLLSKELFKSLAEVAKTGVGILLVEQNARLSLRIADRGYLIENGRVTGENTAQALMNDPAVINAYLGGGASAAPSEADRPAGPRFVLPSFLRLPMDLAGIGRSIAELAGRAGRIQQAFIRVLRREADQPSAFVGRTDPRAGADPWADIAQAPAQPARQAAAVVSRDAQRLGGSASLLAQRASERLAAHVASQRLSSARPSAFVVVKSAPPPASPAPKPEAAAPAVPHGLLGHNSAGLAPQDEPDEPGHPKPVQSEQAASLSIADLAARAASIHAAHVASRRKPLPAAQPVEAWTPAPAPADPIGDLVKRAAAIQAAHVADSRKRLTAYAIPIQPSVKADKDDAASKKRKKHKEA